MLKQLLLVLLNVIGQFLLGILQVSILPFLAVLMIPFGLSLAMVDAWLIYLVSLTAWFVVPFITKSDDPNNPSVSLRDYNTVDDPNGNQGDTESAVTAVESALGWRWKTYYWLAGRNLMYGLANSFRPLYDFSTIQFTVSGPDSGLQKITATWANGSAKEYRLFIPLPFISKRMIISIGYKLAESYLNSTVPLVLNPSPDTNPATDVGGVPFVAVRFK